ncbi:MAG: hypothetical protein C0467_25625 [Planctomycetaceae bacterium]|nr:hypothetical protein [Planctomycetaceae bacterium]
MLVREFVGGDTRPFSCKVVFIDQPSGFGHRVTDGNRVVEHVLTKRSDFDQVIAQKVAEGFAESERSLTRRVFTTLDRFWIVWLDGDVLGTHLGVLSSNWNESVGQTKSKEFRDRERAVAAYHRAIVGKLADGFAERDARAVTVPVVLKVSKKPGKRKSR